MAFEDEYKQAIEDAEKLIEQKKDVKKEQAIEDEKVSSDYEDNASAILWCEITSTISGISAKTDQFGHIIK